MPISAARAATVAPPSGWAWESRPNANYGTGILYISGTATLNAQRFGEAMLALKAWAQQHNVAIAPYTYTGLGGNTIAYHCWSVQISHPFSDQFFLDTTCHCGQTNTIDRITCSGCNRDLKCDRCRALCMTLNAVENDRLTCRNCTVVCACGAQYEYGYTQCGNCSPRATCSGTNCNRQIELNHSYTVGDDHFCSTCYRRICTRCGNTQGTARHPVTGLRICATCLEQIDLESREEFDSNAELSPQRLLVEATPERPVRVCSIEQEFCGGQGTAVGQSLYNAGLSPVSGVADYHYPQHNHPCHVERDSSVDGGELIYHRMRLDTLQDATYMRDILRILREHQQAGRVVMNVRAGLHIHVDLHGYNLSDARHLAMIFNYLEDPLYRLAASHYGGHRTSLTGNNYAMSPPKGVWKTNARFGMDYLRRSEHSHALNLAHFYNAYRTKCTCGAGQFGEDWSLCECESLGKCTAEWRVFNGTTNPRKLHAYVAIAQSITAWSQQRDADADDFPAMTFDMGAKMDRGETQAEQELIDQWKPRLEWMFRNLYFSSGEKEDILYCIRHSDLRFVGEPFLERLTAIQRTPEDRTLEVRHPAQRGAIDEPVQTQAQANPFHNFDLTWDPPEDPYYEDEL